jgi:hypothetical protein
MASCACTSGVRFDPAFSFHLYHLDFCRSAERAGLAIGIWPAFTEVCALLARRVHNLAALDFLDWVQRGAVRLDSPPQGPLGSVADICQRFASRPLDLADASIAEAAAR